MTPGQMAKRPQKEEEEQVSNRTTTGEWEPCLAGPTQNTNYGPNYGTFFQHSTTICRGFSDITSRLNPILDASHTRNLRYSPPNSECLEGTRIDFIRKVIAWAHTKVDSKDVAHILWIYGFAGCGKSAISLAVARQLAEEGLLAASFFFFRGGGDRSRVVRLIATMVCQMVAAVPATSRLVEDTVKRNPWLLSSATADLSAQFRELVFKPILAVWTPLNSGPLTIVLDGVDECEDHDEIGRFVEDTVDCFNKHPLAPLRFVIASRVEDHLHRLLHSSNQVQLLDLVEHTSDADIEIAIASRLERERSGGVLRYDKAWPSEGDKRRLVEHVGKSFIFLTTVLNELFKPFIGDGQTPMDRLPLLLSMSPNFDDLYLSLLRPLQNVPNFLDIISTIAHGKWALTIAQIADLLEIRVVDVVGVLLNLRAIMRVPDDDRSYVTLWHTSFRDFLCSEDRAGAFFASPAHHRRIAYRCVRISTSPARSSPPALGYAKTFGLGHLCDFIKTVPACTTSYNTLLKDILPDLVKAVFRNGGTALQVACEANEWKLVDALVTSGADINTPFLSTFYYLHPPGNFQTVWRRNMDEFLLNTNRDLSEGLKSEERRGSSLLHFTCRRGDVDLVRRLLGQYGANPNLTDGAGKSPLYRVCGRGTPDITQALLEHGADPNMISHKGDTPLHKACRNSMYSYSLAHMEHLFKHNANPNVRGELGNTPLHWAYLEGKTSIAEYLLSHGADPSIKNNDGLTPQECRRPTPTGVGARLEGDLSRGNLVPFDPLVPCFT